MGGLATKPLRILIAGGRGFLGGRIAAYLAEAGHHIILGSRTQAVAPSWLPQAKAVVMQWDNSSALREACDQVDVVIHAAGMNAKECAEDPVSALTVNGVATARLVEAAQASGVTSLIYLSTAHVYASPLVGVINADTCPKNTHPYAASHLAGEQSVLDADARGKIQGTVLRLTNAFGAPMDRFSNCWSLLANDLSRQVITQGRLVLRTNGEQQRDFVAIAGVCRVVQCIVETDIIFKGSRTLNVASGKSMSVLDFARLIQQRSLHVLGFFPELIKENTLSRFATSRLKFEMEFGFQTNDLMASKFQNELDQLLVFCKETFSSRSG